MIWLSNSSMPLTSIKRFSVYAQACCMLTCLLILQLPPVALAGIDEIPSGNLSMWIMNGNVKMGK